MPKLRLHSPPTFPGVGSEFAFRSGDVSIGRAPDNDIVLPEPSVSLRHARLHRDAEGWHLVDLQSANGIWVGPRRVAHLLWEPEQLVRIGGVALQLLIDLEETQPDDPPTPEPADIEGTDPEAAQSDDLPVPESGDIEDADLTVSPSPPATPAGLAPSRKSASAGLIFIIAVTVILVGLGLWVGKRSARHPALPRPIPVSAAPSTASSAPRAAPYLARIRLSPRDPDRVISAGPALRLVVPKGAVKSTTTLTVTAEDRCPPSPTPLLGRWGTAYRVTLSPDRGLLAPMTLILSVESTLAGAVTHPWLGAYYDEAQQLWQIVPSVQDANQRSVSFRARHGALFGLWVPTPRAAWQTIGRVWVVYDPDSNPSLGHGTLAPRTYARRVAARLNAAIGRYLSAGFVAEPGLMAAIVDASLPSSARGAITLHARFTSTVTTPELLERAAAMQAFFPLADTEVDLDSLVRRRWWALAFAEYAADTLGGAPDRVRPVEPADLESSLLSGGPTDDSTARQLIRFLTSQGVTGRALWAAFVDEARQADARRKARGTQLLLPVARAVEATTHRNLVDLYHAFALQVILGSSANRSQPAGASICPSVSRAKLGSAEVEQMTLSVPNTLATNLSCWTDDEPPDEAMTLRVWLNEAPPDGVRVSVLGGTGSALHNSPIPLLRAKEGIDVRRALREPLLVVVTNAGSTSTREIRLSIARRATATPSGASPRSDQPKLTPSSTTSPQTVRPSDAGTKAFTAPGAPTTDANGPDASAASADAGAPTRETTLPDASTESSKSRDASTESSKSRDASTESSKSRDASTESSKSRDASTESSKSRDASTESSKSRDASEPLRPDGP